MFHDVIGGMRNQLPAEKILWGINFRMPELLAAVMLVQLRRLEGLLEAMRQRKQMLVEGMAAAVKAKGVRFQQSHDPNGDASVALIFFMESPEQARQTAAALDAENIPAGVIYKPESIDYHIYAHWTPIVEQRTWTPDGGPWCWAHRKVNYTPEECPRSLNLLSRAVHIDVNPLLSSSDIEETVEGINKVLYAVR